MGYNLESVAQLQSAKRWEFVKYQATQFVVVGVALHLGRICYRRLAMKGSYQFRWMDDTAILGGLGLTGFVLRTRQLQYWKRLEKLDEKLGEDSTEDARLGWAIGEYYGITQVFIAVGMISLGRTYLRWRVFQGPHQFQWKDALAASLIVSTAAVMIKLHRIYRLDCSLDRDK